MIVNQGRWCQVSVSTGTVGIRTVTNILRRLGYRVLTSNMENQVTQHGIIKMTMISIDPGVNNDTLGIDDILRCHIPELRNS